MHGFEASIAKQRMFKAIKLKTKRHCNPHDVADNSPICCENAEKLQKHTFEEGTDITCMDATSR